MKLKFLLSFFCIEVLFCFSSCKSDTLLSTDPVTEVSSSSLSFDGVGGSHNVTFLVSNDWTIQLSAPWFSVSKLYGNEGNVTLTITATANTTTSERTGSLTLKVNGYESSTLLCTVTQAAATSVDKDVNHWMADYMSQAYLWNTEFNTIKDKLDYTIEKPSDFLDAALSSMTTNKIDDGYDYDGDNGATEHHYFSYVEDTSSSTSKAVTRSDNGKATNFGIGQLFAGKLTTSTYALGVDYVYAGSPAEKARIKRGALITKYNGASITASNLNDIYYALIGYDNTSSVSLTTKSYVFYNEENKNGYYLSDADTTFTISKATYDANPILASKTIKPEGSGHIIGYFSYAGFDYYHDKEMLDAFSQFKKDGITDLVLDLRYNGGGYVNSSATLATLVAGSGYEGNVYSSMQYNADRTANGEVGYYYIGKSPSFYDPDKKKMVTDNYDMITKALDNAVNLKKVYVLTTDNTASASELIINGLRGLDIDVITVGTTTIGKNVGMEVIESDDYKKDYDFEGHSYEFAPITFKSYNAKNQSDYADGFEPNCEVDETSRLFEWGKYSTDIDSNDNYSTTISVKVGADPMLSCAIYNVLNGSWPNTSVTTKTGSRSIVNSIPLDAKFSKMARKHNLRGSIVVKRLPKE